MADALPVRTVAVVLFEGFTVLDVYGPVQAFSASMQRQPNGSIHRYFKVITIAEQAGPVRAGEGPATVADFGFADAPAFDILLVPGGMGTRRAVNEPAFLSLLTSQSEKASEMTTAVCTG